jgi:Ca2+-binding RTX toxin-like protein
VVALGRGGRDRILGSDGADALYGGGNDDVLIGYWGRDTLSGDGGNDTLRARDGQRDEISCGVGNDRREKAIRDRFDRKITTVWGGSWVDREPISC